MTKDAQKEYLQNFADSLGLTIHEEYSTDRRATVRKFFAAKDKMSVSPVLNYDKLNHFLLGWHNCLKQVNS